jgi:3-(3-hydroxy-phenyl)propionate hydroxylase
MQDTRRRDPDGWGGRVESVGRTRSEAMSREQTVLVVGAGPVGSVMALALCRRGVPVILIDQLETPEIECRAASCHPPTVAMLRDLDLLETGLEQGLVSPVFQYLDRPTGEIIATFDIRKMRRPPEHAYVLQWEQYKITQTIVQRLRSHPLATLKLGLRAVALADDGEAVTLTLEDPDGAREAVTGAYLVGCDGGRSTIRKLAEISFDGFTWPERFIKIDTRFDFFSLNDKLHNRNYFSDPERWLNLFKARGPDGEGLWRAVSPAVPGERDEDLVSPEALEARLQLFCPKPGAYEIATAAIYSVHQRVAETFNRGRVLLAGDAAHVNNPVGGMGMNGGIHDAVNLAEKLEAILLTGAPAVPLLDRYTAERRKAQVDYIQAQSIQNKETLGESDPEVRAAKLDTIRRIGADQDKHDAFIRRACLIDSLADAPA